MTNTSVEFARLWQSNRSGIELFQAQLFRHSFSKHMHEEYTIGMNDGGQGCYTYRGATYQPHAGSFHFINPGEIHTGQVNGEKGWAFRNLYISVARVKQTLIQLEWSDRHLPYFSQSIAVDRSLQFPFHQLFQALSLPTSQLEQDSLMLEFLSQLFLKHAQVRHLLQPLQLETKAITEIRAYLEAHYRENISIDALAQLVGLSPYYLIRSFHQQVGLPPHAYQRHWQLLQAKRSLRTSKSLSEIAVENGFYDQSHFNRHFKRAFGITPGQYQKSNSIQYG